MIKRNREPLHNLPHFHNHRVKLHENQAKHAEILAHCGYGINVVGFFLDNNESKAILSTANAIAIL